VKLGVVVAPPALAGGVAQQWMCEAVVPATKPLNVALTRISCVVEFSVTTALPVPGEATGGFSLAPLSVTL
jgi:hypothetical protein